MLRTLSNFLLSICLVLLDNPLVRLTSGRKVNYSRVTGYSLLFIGMMYFITSTSFVLVDLDQIGFPCSNSIPQKRLLFVQGRQLVLQACVLPVPAEQSVHLLDELHLLGGGDRDSPSFQTQHPELRGGALEDKDPLSPHLVLDVLHPALFHHQRRDQRAQSVGLHLHPLRELLRAGSLCSLSWLFSTPTARDTATRSPPGGRHTI